MQGNEPAAQVADDGTGIPPDMVEGQEGSPPATTDQGTEPSPQEKAEQDFARRLGWRPKEEFRGPEHKWVDHKQFIDKTQTEAPLLRSQLRKQDEKLQQQEKLLKEQGETLRELLDRDRTREARGYDWARENLKQRMRQAVADADTQAFAAAEREMEELDKLKPAPKPEKKPDTGKPDGAAEIDPETQAWLGKNHWFSTDTELNDEMIAEERIILRKIALGQLPNMGTTERLDKAKEKLKERFPTKFGNPARNQPPAASRPGPQGARPAPKKVKTEADLPPSARAVMDRLVRQKVLTKEQYLKDYKWDN